MDAFTGKFCGSSSVGKEYFASIRLLKSLRRVSRLYDVVFREALWSKAYITVRNKAKARQLVESHADLLKKIRSITFEHHDSPFPAFHFCARDCSQACQSEKRSLRAQDIVRVLAECTRLSQLHLIASCTSKWKGPEYTALRRAGNLKTVKRFTLTIAGWEENLSFVTNPLALVPNFEVIDLYAIGAFANDRASHFVSLPKLREVALFGLNVVVGRGDRDDVACLLSFATIKRIEKCTTDFVDGIIGPPDTPRSQRPPLERLTSMVVKDGASPFVALAVPTYVYMFDPLPALAHLDLSGVWQDVDCARRTFEELPRTLKTIKMGTQVNDFVSHAPEQFIQALEGKSLELAVFEGISHPDDYFAIRKSDVQQSIDTIHASCGVKVRISFPGIVGASELAKARRMIPGFSVSRTADVDLYDAFTGIFDRKEWLEPRTK